MRPDPNPHQDKGTQDPDTLHIQGIRDEDTPEMPQANARRDREAKDPRPWIHGQQMQGQTQEAPEQQQPSRTAGPACGNGKIHPCGLNERSLPQGHLSADFIGDRVGTGCRRYMHQHPFLLRAHESVFKGGQKRQVAGGLAGRQAARHAVIEC